LLLINDLTTPINAIKKSGEVLYAKLFKDDLDNTKSTVIISDGILHYLPFEILVNKNQYLIENHTISYAPNFYFLSALNTTSTVSFEDAKGLAGTDLGASSWREVTQEQVNLFADATDDHQWIHTDPERAAKESPFGGPIAHGYLTLSLVIPMWDELLDVTGVGMKVNYGLNKVRFPAPVPVGSRIRMTGAVAEVTEVGGNGLQVTVDGVIEVDGGAKPAVVFTGLYRFYK
jgi:acyl dehydratase